jgi:hypothetical protein
MPGHVAAPPIVIGRGKGWRVMIIPESALFGGVPFGLKYSPEILS